MPFVLSSFLELPSVRLRPVQVCGLRATSLNGLDWFRLLRAALACPVAKTYVVLSPFPLNCLVNVFLLISRTQFVKYSVCQIFDQVSQ
jgi:hypothetical protein